LDGTKQADLLYPLVSLQRRVRIRAVVQREPKGLGHAILCARKAVGGEPFAVLLPDEIFDGEASPTEELLEVAASNPGAALAAVVRVPRAETRRYGIVDAKRQGEVYKVRRAVEKPEPAKAPSTLALVGRYVLPPDVFGLLAASRPSGGRELHLTTALDALARQGRFFVLPTQCRRFDTGNPKGWLTANLHFGRRILGEA
ncbi:MAG: sugar phosphate nucleotidyltransferase, partial [Bdellovibrionota bacterium]